MEVCDDGVHDAFVPGTAKSPVSQEPLREGEDGGRKGGSSGQAMEFHLSQSNGQLLSRAVLSRKGPCVDASVFERSLWCSGGSGLQRPRAFQKRLL